MNAPQHPPGWYPDPHGPGQRYWDGVQWTEHHAPGQQKSKTGRNLLIAGLVILGVLAVGVIGCAALVSTSTTPDELQDEQEENRGGSSERGIPGAEQTVKSYLAAFSRADGEAVCGFFSEAYEKDFVRRNAALPARNCPELVRKLHARLEQAGGLAFEGTKLTPSVVRNLDLKTALRLAPGDGDSATVKGPKGQQVFELKVIDGHWTITTISS
jgi:Protein of unknown function (DUF2510)